MSAAVLLLVALGGSFAVGWLIHYLPLHIEIWKWQFSPRLAACKLVAPFDAAITITMITGAWVGLTTITGIGFMVYNVLTGLGLSLGAVLVRKVLAPRWEKQYRAIRAQKMYELE